MAGQNLSEELECCKSDVLGRALELKRLLCHGDELVEFVVQMADGNNGAEGHHELDGSLVVDSALVRA